ncbi:hypothetical protein GQ607_007662 [Colletotrichum asianum]|uniref:C2H2-type domain-containing protein n=1 Tax=Colletotrichum asianum TaxID=702518 RepID=A0A8H3WFZ5_9PEZI|nr:hypothetical protein GQ607_007662 [Colletotrichum asianum]
MEEATFNQPQLLRTKSTMGYGKASIGNAGPLLGLEVCPRHQMFKDLENGSNPELGSWDVDNWQNDSPQSNLSDGPCSLADLESSDENPPTTPDTEDFVSSKSPPPTCVPPRLQYSKAFTYFNILMSNVDKGIGESACLELVERLDLLKTTSHICQLLDFFLVSLYHWDIYRRFLFLIQKTDTDGCFTHTTIIVLFKADPPFQTPHWLLCVIERENWYGRWLNEVSIEWIDTTWRTAFSVLHVGSISPVASLPRVTTGRLKALWEVQSLLASDAASEKQFTNTAIPVRTRHNGQKRPSSSNTTIQALETGKRQRTGNGRGGHRQQDEEPEDSSSENEAPKEPEDETNASPSNSKGRQFACHFWKLDPQKYGKCRYHGQTATRHVKRHLIRSHKAPMYCPICYKAFGARGEWDQHIVDRGCEQNTGSNPWDKLITDDIEKKFSSPNQVKGEREKWFKLWDILFPHEPRPLTPFVDSHNGVEVRSAVPNVIGHQTELFQQSLEELRVEGVLNAEQVRRVMDQYTRTSEIGAPSRPGPSNEPTGPSTSPSPPSVATQQQSTQTGMGFDIRDASTPTAVFTTISADVNGKNNV